jgi:hypothetical protein
MKLIVIEVLDVNLPILLTDVCAMINVIIVIVITIMDVYLFILNAMTMMLVLTTLVTLILDVYSLPRKIRTEINV